MEYFERSLGQAAAGVTFFSFLCAISKSCKSYCSVSFLCVGVLHERRSTILDAIMAFNRNDTWKGKALSMENFICLVRIGTVTCFIFVGVADLILSWIWIVGGLTRVHGDSFLVAHASHVAFLLGGPLAM